MTGVFFSVTMHWVEYDVTYSSMKHFTFWILVILEGKHGAHEGQHGTHEGQHGAHEVQHGTHKRQRGAAPLERVIDETLNWGNCSLTRQKGGVDATHRKDIQITFLRECIITGPLSFTRSKFCFATWSQNFKMIRIVLVCVLDNSYHTFSHRAPFSIITLVLCYKCVIQHCRVMQRVLVEDSSPKEFYYAWTVFEDAHRNHTFHKMSQHSLHLCRDKLYFCGGKNIATSHIIDIYSVIFPHVIFIISKLI